MKLTHQLISSKGNYSDRNTLNDLSGSQWIQHTKSWHIVDGKPTQITKEIRNHPASFPPELAEFFISYFTKSQQWVFDPFLGIGSTLAACQTIKRNGFGIELNAEYAKFAKHRLSQTKLLKDQNKLIVRNGDARKGVDIWRNQGLPLMDFLITSPPYWNMLKTSRGGVDSTQKRRIANGYDEYYSEKTADIGNIDDLGVYLHDLCKIFIDFKPLLKPGAYLMVIMQNCRPKDGIMRPIAWDFANLLKKHYLLQQEYIWLQDQKYAGIWGYPTTYVSNVHHHYCLVFQNPNE